MKESLTSENLKDFSGKFNASPANRIAMNAVTKNGIGKAAASPCAGAKYPHAFNVCIDAGEITDQKHSGRCWMFASLNVFRLQVMEKLNLKNMELSQNYTLFYDKLEKSNYFLENILDTMDEPLEGRVMAYLLQDPVGDGGQWDMFRSLIAKYGIVPKDIYPETAVSENTTELHQYLTTKLRGYATELRKAHAAGESKEELRKRKDSMMETVYRILAISLGEPPARFTWDTKDKDGKYISVKDVTPLEFYEKYVGLPLDDLVTVINAPTGDKPFHKTYTVQYLGNVRGGKYPVKYLNLPMEDLKNLAIAQLKDGFPVWFGSDVGQFSDRLGGILAEDAIEVDQLFTTDFPMTKAERLDYGESRMTHAMVLTGVELDDRGQPVRWRVENSWGPDHGDKGYYCMSDHWFSEFAYQILLNRKYFSAAQAAQYDTAPVLLKPWDPMGSLAF